MKKTFFTLLAAPIAAAMIQAAPSDTLTVLMDELDELVVSRPVMQVTNSKQELKHAELNRINTGQNLPYLLQSTPSLVSTSDDGLGVGYTYFRIRGTDHTRINMTLNDVPLNDAESQTVFWVNLTDMASGVNSLQVQRGVGTSANGGSSFGASVNIRTLDDIFLKEPSPRPGPVRAELDFNGGMYRTFREMVKVDGYWGERESSTGAWHAGARFSKVNSDGYVARASSDLLSYQATLGWARRNTTLSLLAFGGKERTYMAWNGLTRTQIEEDRRQNTAGWYMDNNDNEHFYDDQTDNYQQHHVHLNLTHRFNLHWSLSATAHYTFGTGYYEQVGLDNTYWCYLHDIGQYGLRNHFYGGIITAKYIHEKVDVQMGVALNNYNGTQYGKMDTLSGNGMQDYYKGYGDKLDGNIYAKANWHVLHRGQEKLSLYGDIQYRLVDYRLSGDNEYTLAAVDEHHTYHFFNPKAGLTYDNGGHRLSATFAIANREPVRTCFTDWHDTQNSPKSEQLFDYELGYSYSSQGRLRSGYTMPWHIGLNLYMMDYKDQFVLTGELNMLSYALTKNVDKSYRLGAEFQFGVEWTKWFSWQGNLTWSRNKWKDGDTWRTISFSPDWIAGNTFSFHAAGFNGDIQTQVVSDQYLDNTASSDYRLKTYTVTNVNLSYLLPLGHIRNCPDITIKCQINNLFNSLYESNGSVWWNDGKKTAYYMPQAGINVHAGFAVRW